MYDYLWVVFAVLSVGSLLLVGLGLDEYAVVALLVAAAVWGTTVLAAAIRVLRGP